MLLSGGSKRSVRERCLGRKVLYNNANAPGVKLQPRGLPQSFFSRNLYWAKMLCTASSETGLILHRIHVPVTVYCKQRLICTIPSILLGINRQWELQRMLDDSSILYHLPHFQSWQELCNIWREKIRQHDIDQK